MIKNKIKFIFFILFLFSNPMYLNSATVTCTFLSETSINSDGDWLKTETNILKLFEMFGDGLILDLENSLLVKLDERVPFLAGEIDRGNVYLKGGDTGVEGKLISIDNDILIIYDGMCTISFG